MELQSVWGWQPALYLFLGGMGAGAFIMAAIMYLRDKERNTRIVCVSMWAAAISLIVGLLLLLAELVTPVRGLLMWQSFSHWTSWMTYGAWGAFGAIAAFGVSAVLATKKFAELLTGKCSWYAKNEHGVRKVFAIAGIVLGAFVAFYTGMLLMASESVPFWDTLLLPALFTVSAFDTGVALVEVISIALAKKESIDHATKRFMEKCVVVLVLLEVAVLAVFLGTMLSADASTPIGAAAAASAALFVSGDLAVWFWGLVAVLGLALPLVMALKGLMSKKESSDSVDFAALTGALGALVGGCALRFLVLAAGVHADVVADTIMKMIG